MTRPRFFAAALAPILLAACMPTAPPPVEVTPLVRSISYLEDVKPILDNRCVVCHSCWNAPCQLQLGSHEGVDRGASKIPVYLGSRLKTQEPTRLFVDAHTSAEWRAKGFFSVTDTRATKHETKSSKGDGYNDSLMLHLLEQKQRNPKAIGSYESEAENLTCAANTAELGVFLHEHPERGMPFGFPALSPSEHEVLATWLERGAPGPTPEEQTALETPGKAAAAKIEKWEAFLNAKDAKSAMTARYLYEHFFLAHLVFPDAAPKEFYQLVRSRTPPGEPVSIIATVRPYDDPDTRDFWYRFEKIRSTIVYKTHMVVEWDDARLARYRELFLDSEWLEEPHVVAVNAKTDANPFLVYAQIPPIVRYQFLLDQSEYFIQTFIRGPVCKGQVALNVIHDQFWIFFLDPAADLTVKNPEFLIAQAKNLRLPDDAGSDPSLVESFSDAYRERYAAFYKAKTQLYSEKNPGGLGLDAIWAGREPSDSPVLTVYRHFDSASVHRGALGRLPRTAWVIDYSQFERIYYALVAGFDVFGNMAHQINVRRYMDYLRMEGELNFLGFLPRASRLDILKSWYIGDGAIEDVGPDEALQHWEAKIPFKTKDPKREFVEMVIADRVLASADIKFDRINYRWAEHDPVKMPSSFETREDILAGFRSLTAPGTAFIEHHNGSNANVLFVHFRNYQAKDYFVSIVINRWHDNVNSMFGEAKRLDASKDTMDFIPHGIGEYPNYFFEVDGSDIPDFFDMLANFDDSPAYAAKLRKYGVNRADPDFWQAYAWFQQELDEADPMRAGLYDLNRYGSRVADQAEGSKGSVDR